MEISVEEAIKKAYWQIKLPSMAVLIIPLLTYAVLAKTGILPAKGSEAFKWAGPTFFVSFLGSWLVWSIQVPRWKLWAYSRVDDLSALKEAAVERQLIWSDDSIFVKTELANKELKQEINRIERTRE